MKDNNNNSTAKPQTRYVYVAGPISGIENGNHDLFCQVEEELKAQGNVVVFNPCAATRNLGIDQAQTHIGGSERRHVMKIDVNWILDYATEIVALPGALNSKGATAEISLARSVGIPVVFYKKRKSKNAKAQKNPQTNIRIKNPVVADTSLSK